MRRITLASALPILFTLVVAVGAQPSYALCHQSAELTVTQGEVKTGFYLKFSNYGEIATHVAAKVSDSAADWVDPQTVDFGTLAAGEEKKVENAFKLAVPENAVPGSYRLVWSFYDADSPTQTFGCWIYIIQVVQKTGQSGLIQVGLDTQAFIILGAIGVVAVLAIVVATMRRRAAPAPSMPLSTAAAHMYCIECGSPIPLEAAHCPRCGTKQ